MKTEWSFKKVAVWCTLSGKRGLIMKGISQKNEKKFLVLSEEGGLLIVKGSFVIKGNDVEAFFNDLEKIICEKVFVRFLEFSL